MCVVSNLAWNLRKRKRLLIAYNKEEANNYEYQAGR